PHGYPAEGSDSAAGEYALDRASAEFMLTNSVNVKLRGSTRMVMHNDMHVALIRGTATFRCPPAAKGFVVDLPGDARVTDLGTEFAVRTLDSGAREVYVIDGLVELAADDGSVQYLVEGEGYRIDFDGAVAALTRPAILDTFGSIALSGDAYQQMVLDEEPVAYWPMASGDQRIIDLVTDQTADAHGTRFDTQGPHNDAAVAFDGSAFVDLGQRPDLLIPGPMTVEAWVWIDPNIKLHGRIISFDGMQGGGWALGYTPVSDTKHKPGVVFTMLGVADYPFADARIEHGRWTHLAITLSASRELTLYFDGQPVGTQSGIVDFAMPRSPRAFLGQQSPAVVPLVGRLAHVAVYDHVLEPSLLRSRYSALKQETPRPHVKELSK
nr:hypothetical protein [Pseudomonadota bacterium]